MTWLEHRHIDRVGDVLVSCPLLGMLTAGAVYLIPLTARQAGTLVRMSALAAEAQVTWDRYLALFHQPPCQPPSADLD
ncbi:MAG: hypothetical protein M0Z54_06470, partial [Thermaerobacter sp.]|nr:hypothetical protein [Thermaerobacter sp.]